MNVAHIIDGKVVLTLTAATLKPKPNSNSFFHNEKIISLELERQKNDSLLKETSEFHYYIERRSLAPPYDSLKAPVLPNGLTKIWLSSLLSYVFNVKSPSTKHKKSFIITEINERLSKISPSEWIKLSAFFSHLPASHGSSGGGGGGNITIPPIPINSQRYYEIYHKSLYLDLHFFPLLLSNDADIIKDRIDNLLYPDDTDPFLNLNSSRKYISTIGKSCILTFIRPHETISHDIPLSGFDLKKYLIEPVIFVLSQKTGQYKIHRTMVLSWTFEVYSKDLKDSALIGKHCFGKFSSFSDEEIDFLMNSKGNSLLFLQISNQHLLSRLGGGGEDDIVVLQCFLVDPSEKGDLVLGSGGAGGGGGSPSTCLPILGKNEILNNLKTSMIEQITITNRCPFSFVRMAIPVRSRFCHHLQSFDFMSALKIAYPDSLLPPISVSDYDHRLKTIKCPICGVEFCLGDLFRDGLTDYILEMDMDGLCKYDIDIESSTIKCSTEKFIERRSPEFIDLTLTVDEIVEEGFVFEEMESPLPLIKRDPVLDDEDFDSNISKKRRNGDSGDCVFDAIILE